MKLWTFLFLIINFVEVLLKKDMEHIVSYLQEQLVEDYGYKDDYTIETLQETLNGEFYLHTLKIFVMSKPDIIVFRELQNRSENKMKINCLVFNIVS